MLGVLPGIMGGIEAAEAINLILRLGDPFIGRLILLNTIDMRFTEIRIGKNPDCPMCGTKPSIRELLDYEAFCGVARVASKSVPEVAPVLLGKWLNEGKEVELLGVREPFEYQICHLETSKLIPLGQPQARVGELDGSKTLVVYCHTGQRSARAVEYLSAAGFTNAKNLKGGITAWTARGGPDDAGILNNCSSKIPTLPTRVGADVDGMGWRTRSTKCSHSAKLF